jgi:hypothetical protein
MKDLVIGFTATGRLGIKEISPDWLILHRTKK